MVRGTISPILSVVDVVGKPIIYRRRDVLVVDIPVKEREDVSCSSHKYMYIFCVYFYGAIISKCSLILIINYRGMMYLHKSMTNNDIIPLTSVGNLLKTVRDPFSFMVQQEYPLFLVKHTHKILCDTEKVSFVFSQFLLTFLF